mgnify:CR=1 FL=1
MKYCCVYALRGLVSFVKVNGAVDNPNAVPEEYLEAGTWYGEAHKCNNEAQRQLVSKIGDEIGVIQRT